MDVLAHWPKMIELCHDCTDGRSTRPEIACQHVARWDDEGDMIEVVPASQLAGAVETALREIVAEAGGDEDFVSDYDLAMRVGSIVVNRLRGQ
jgi:hypothetical protein